uniref:Uncharacterized protein n=1 Tax=Anguilla anguilla TaxID=7936 RepID=A0A0E9UU05_ANGAN
MFQHILGTVPRTVQLRSQHGCHRKRLSHGERCPNA